MEITEKELSLIDEWIEFHKELEKREDEIKTLTGKLKQISSKLYDKSSKVELEEFRDSLAAEIEKLDKEAGKDRIKQLKDLKSIVQHDINIETLVEQDIDIEEQAVQIDLKDYNS